MSHGTDPIERALMDAHRERVSAWSGGRVRIRMAGKADVEGEAIPLGNGRALLQPLEIELLPGIVAELGVRNGRGGVVAIRSTPDGPVLTHTLLRQLGPLGADAASEVLERNALLLTDVEADGVAVGIPLASLPAVTSAVDEMHRVVEAYRKAEREGRATGPAVAETLGVTLNVAKKRIRRARDRGLLPPPRAAKKKGGTG